MTSFFSPSVIALGALLSSPALFASFVDGTLPLETGLIRFGVACVVAWFGLSLLDMLMHATSAPAVREDTTPIEATQVLPPIDQG